MNPVLLDVIERFRAAQDRGVAAFVEQLGFPLPTSNRQWVTFCANQGLYRIRSINGIGIYAHGYGIELIFDDLTIDFDWGDAGEPDGFDAWRLWCFIRDNKLDVACEGHRQMISWVEDAHQCGELIQDRLYGLYYSPPHRAPGHDRGIKPSREPEL